jgi:hypothetical protein
MGSATGEAEPAAPGPEGAPASPRPEGAEGARRAPGAPRAEETEAAQGATRSEPGDEKPAGQAGAGSPSASPVGGAAPTTAEECSAAGGTIAPSIGGRPSCPEGKQSIGSIRHGIEGALCCR